MSSTPLPNISCGRCHTSAAELGRSMQRCGACRAVYYCDRDCQRADWQEHRSQCRDIQAGLRPNRARTTMRMSYLDFMAKSDNDDNDDSDDSIDEGASTATNNGDMFYYLKNSVPHLFNVGITGPHKDLAGVHAQALGEFASECASGCRAVRNMTENGRPLPFEHISSPINGDPNRVRRLQLIQKTDAAIASRLPCPTWTVMVGMLLDLPSGPNANGIHVKDMNVHECYLTKSEANQEAMQQAQRLAGRATIQTVGEDPLVLHVLERGSNKPKEFVVVHYDDGTLVEVSMRR